MYCEIGVAGVSGGLSILDFLIAPSERTQKLKTQLNTKNKIVAILSFHYNDELSITILII
jgi:hypothetical protein